MPGVGAVPAQGLHGHTECQVTQLEVAMSDAGWYSLLPKPLTHHQLDYQPGKQTQD